MKFIDEYRQPETAARYVREIARMVTKPWTIMEICGGQTHTIVRYGIDRLLPEQITLLHGPGCPVCVTPVELIDKAIEIAAHKNVIFCSFGDMLRVPGSTRDLLTVKAEGADVRVMYSPTDSLRIAQEHKSKEVVFFAIGFETTAPVNALAVCQAKRMGIHNFSVLVAQVLVPPAVETILASPDCGVQGFLAAGHVCTVMGYTEYEELAARFGVPIIVTGFEPLDILQGICLTIDQLEQGKAEVENAYARAVRREGNVEAQRLINNVFAVTNRKWRGLGEIPDSGLKLAEEYAEFDAERRFGIANFTVEEPTECISGLILQGRKKPYDCAAYGGRCTPEHPLGATMVSSEGACAAYYRYRMNRATESSDYSTGIISDEHKR